MKRCTVEQFNAVARFDLNRKGLYASDFPRLLPNLGCDACGEPVVEPYEEVITTFPGKRRVECSKCDWKGYRTMVSYDE